jgi:tetratricopeptide (TPR) repeat protein
MEQRRELGSMSGVDKVFLSVGLMHTGQFERATTEGSFFFQPDALYSIGRVDEAFDLARQQAVGGNPGNFFHLLVRANRDQELVDYVEERWPSLSAFAGEYSGNQNGYDIMANIALAYSRTGNMDRFEEAMYFVDQRVSSLAEQGIENFVFRGNQAIYYALLGDFDAAFEHLKLAVERGWVVVGDLAEVEPALAALADDPRFAKIEATMLAKVNGYRELLGLALFDENYQVRL